MNEVKFRSKTIDEVTAERPWRTANYIFCSFFSSMPILFFSILFVLSGQWFEMALPLIVLAVLYDVFLVPKMFHEFRIADRDLVENIFDVRFDDRKIKIEEFYKINIKILYVIITFLFSVFVVNLLGYYLIDSVDFHSIYDDLFFAAICSISLYLLILHGVFRRSKFFPKNLYGNPDYVSGKDYYGRESPYITSTQQLAKSAIFLFSYKGVRVIFIPVFLFILIVLILFGLPFLNISFYDYTNQEFFIKFILTIGQVSFVVGMVEALRLIKIQEIARAIVSKQKEYDLTSKE